jgi:hypothetical protein
VPVADPRSNPVVAMCAFLPPGVVPFTTADTLGDLDRGDLLELVVASQR